MDSRVKELWVDALRRGDYIQCKGTLKNSDGHYCCLGVLEELHKKENPNHDFDGSDPALCTYTKHWAGLHSHDPVVEDASGKKQLLSYWNDTAGLSFTEIAALIEKQL